MTEQLYIDFIKFINNNDGFYLSMTSYDDRDYINESVSICHIDSLYVLLPINYKEDNNYFETTYNERYKWFIDVDRKKEAELVKKLFNNYIKPFIRKEKINSLLKKED